MGLVNYPVFCFCLAFATTPVLAQKKDPVQDDQPRLSQQISPEENDVIWKLEALGFSYNLKLPEEATTQVVRAYTSSRVRLQKANRKAVLGEDSDSPGRKGPGISGDTALMLSQHMKKERMTLLENLRPLLAETQLEHAMLTLGSYSQDWDRMVHTITGFAFSREKTLVALSPIEVFIARMSDSNNRSKDRVEMQQQLQTQRLELMKSISYLLEDEQIKTFRLVADKIKIHNWQNASRDARQTDTQPKSSSDPNQSPLPRKLKRYDSNGDGKLTREELPEFLHKLLDQLDANKDDILDAEELKEIKARNG